MLDQVAPKHFTVFWEWVTIDTSQLAYGAYLDFSLTDSTEGSSPKATVLWLAQPSRLVMTHTRNMQSLKQNSTRKAFLSIIVGGWKKHPPAS
jgi:hypothetical protein